MFSPPPSLPTGTDRSPLRAEIFRTAGLALPLIGASAGTQLISVVDTAIVGRLGPVDIAGNGMGNAVFSLTAIMALGMVLGLDPLASQAVGAGRFADARRHFRDGMVLAGLLAVPFIGLCLLGVLFLPEMGASAEIQATTWWFLLGRAPAILPFLMLTVSRSYLQSLGRTRPSLWAMVVGNIVNVPLALLLVHGDRGLALLGMPPLGLGGGLGVFGAGLSWTLCVTVQLGVLLLSVAGVRVPAGTGGVTAAGVRALLRLGFPVGVQFLAEVGVFAGAQLAMGRFGPTWTAAHNVAIQLASFTFCMCLGLSQAAAVRVGHEVGRQDWAGARRAGIVALWLAVAVMGTAAGVFLVAPTWLAGLLAAPPDVIEAATALIVIGAFFQVFDGVQVVASGALRGAGDTRASMWVNVVAHWAFTAPAIILSGIIWGYGPHGMWWSLTAGLAVVALGLTARFLRLTALHKPPNS